MENQVIDRPLLKLAETFEQLASKVNSQSEDLELGFLIHGFSLMLPLLRSFGIVFKIVESDAVQKVDDLMETAKSVSSVRLMIENDIANGCVRTLYSPSRNLLRLIRGLDFCRLFFRNILNEGKQNSVRIPATTAYLEVFGPYHGAILKKIITVGIHTVPTMSKICKNVNEDEDSGRVSMQNFARSSQVVIQYLHNLFLSMNQGIDW